MTLSADRVRLELGNPPEADISDDNIDTIISEEANNLFVVASRCAELLSLYYAQKPDIKLGDYSESFSQRAKHYSALAKTLKGKAIAKTAKPYFGGTSISDKERNKQDTDRPEPDFERGFMEV